MEEYVNTTVQSRYFWGLRYIDDLLVYRTGSTDYFIIQDTNWNVVALSSATGTILERYTYTAFGKRNIHSPDFTPRPTSSYPSFTRSFTGQVLDPETGLLLYRNRHYHPDLGRFIQRDPIGYAEKDRNLYRYVLNTSTLYTDTFGLTSLMPTPPDMEKFGCKCHKKEAISRTDACRILFNTFQKEELMPAGAVALVYANGTWTAYPCVFIEYSVPGWRDQIASRIIQACIFKHEMHHVRTYDNAFFAYPHPKSTKCDRVKILKLNRFFYIRSKEECAASTIGFECLKEGMNNCGEDEVCKNIVNSYMEMEQENIDRYC